MKGAVLVAGSSGGIGAACVRRLTTGGWDVLGVDREDGGDRGWTLR